MTAAGVTLQRADMAAFEQGHVTEIQRSRLLAAAVRTVEELGYPGATVAHITRRARVSRRTFYELFANRDECMAALLESVVADVCRELAGADIAGLPWRKRMRRGLETILAFLDREPALARVCVVQLARGGQEVLEGRERVLARLAVAVDEGRRESARGAQCPPLTSEGLVGAAVAIVHARLLHRSREPLRSLVGELAGMIVLPYLGSAAARRERTIGASSPPVARVSRVRPPESEGRTSRDPLADVPMRLTYRTARVLEAISQRPHICNREVGEQAGVTDPGQISKLLARLERLGLIANDRQRGRKGEANAWALSATGREVARSISGHMRRDGARRAA